MTVEKLQSNIDKVSQETKEAIAALTKAVERQQEEISEKLITSKSSHDAVKAAENVVREAMAELKGNVGQLQETFQEQLDGLEKKLARANLPMGGNVDAIWEKKQIETNAARMWLLSREFLQFKGEKQQSSRLFETKTLFNAKTSAAEVKAALQGLSEGEQKALTKIVDPHGMKGLADGASADLLDVQAVENIIGILGQPQRHQVFPTVRSLFPQVFTTRDSIRYNRHVTTTNAAAMVARGVERPESEMDYEKVTASSKILGHHINVDREDLDDVDVLMDHIESELFYGLRLVEDFQLLYGDGTGQNLLGLLHATSGVPEYYQNSNPQNVNKLDAVMRSFTKVRKAYFPVTGAVFEPEDWEDIVLAKGDDDHYIWAVVTEMNQKRLFAVPVVDTPAIQKGRWLAGAFGMGARLYDRLQAILRATDSHASNFTKQIVTILAEERLLYTIPYPKAFIHGRFTPTS